VKRELAEGQTDDNDYAISTADPARTDDNDYAISTADPARSDTTLHKERLFGRISSI
jgi:hypothetical protein